jgi:feruloyl esterase
VLRRKAPGMLIAAHLDEAKKPDLTRPLCAYPREARYTGSGDIKDAKNFTCMAPQN